MDYGKIDRRCNAWMGWDASWCRWGMKGTRVIYGVQKSVQVRDDLATVSCNSFKSELLQITFNF